VSYLGLINLHELLESTESLTIVICRTFFYFLEGISLKKKGSEKYGKTRNWKILCNEI